MGQTLFHQIDPEIDWNDIPDNINERESVARFKTGFREYLLNLQDLNTTPW